MAYKQKNYFEFRDSLASGEPDKVIKGKHFDDEFRAIQEAFENVTADIHVDEIEGLEGLLNEKADQSALEKEIEDRIKGDKDLQDQIDNLEPYDDSQIKEELGNLDDKIDKEIGDRGEADKALQNQIDALDKGKADDDDLQQEIRDRQDGDAALDKRIDELVTDDLVDVNSASASVDQFLIHNGTQWVAEDFHIDTELTYMGGISVPNDPAPSASNGDLYINNEKGIAGSSWTGIADREINAANAVGWSEKNGRWYILGDIASASVQRVEAGLGIDVDNDTKPAEPVVSIDRTEVNKWYEPPISPKNSAFNKSFGTTAGTVAEGDHTHSQYLTDFTETDPTVPQHVKDIKTTDIARWDEAHGWGDHSQEGYLKAGDVPDVDQTDKISKTDTNDQQVVSNFKSLKDITAAKFVGDGSSLTGITTNQLSDVSSASAKKDDFLIHNGSNWVAEAFHIDTELTYQGAWNLTAAPPTTKNNGDLYINNTDGVVHSGWAGIAGTTVREGNVVGWAASKNRWYLLGDIASSSVTEVKGGTGITVNSNEPAKPIVNLDLATASNRGGVKIGYSANGKNYPVQLSNEQMYVSVPWTDTNNVPDGSRSGDTLQWQQGNGWVISQGFSTDDIANETAVSTKTFDFYGNGAGSKATFHVNTSVNGVMEATTVKKAGGTANQLLCADGSVVGKGDVGAGAYSLPLAANGTRGGVQVGYTTSGKNYAVQLSGEKMYVNVPWTDTPADLTGYATEAWVTTNHYKKTETKKNVVMTEAQYNALGSKDAETIYFLT
jgi:hypothetical protein